MDIKFIVIMVTTTMMLSGCLTTSKINTVNPYGWKDLNPPRQNALGRELFSNGSIGEPVYNLNSENVLVSGSVDKVTDKRSSAAKASLDVIAQAASIQLGYDYIKSQNLSSSDWQISQIKDFSYVIPVAKKFVYQCITASRYEFSASSKSGFNADVDVTEIAKKFKIDTAKVSIVSKPDSPNEFKVIVNDPSICISYVSAYFKDDNRYPGGTLIGKYVDITGVTGAGETQAEIYSTKFELKPGESSHRRTPQFIGREPGHKPEYTLMATLGEQGLVNLNVCKQDKGTGAVDLGKSIYDISYKRECKEIKDNGFGKWDRLYHIDTFSYENQKYKVIYVNINAKRTTENNIQINYARLSYPQYELILE